MNAKALFTPLLGAFFFFTFTGASPIQAVEQPSHQPYAGQQQRTIKALSRKEIKDYQKGAGLGMAKAAELNHYPGPIHVLELASHLNLSAAQKKEIESLYQQMKADAVPLGVKVIALESELDQLFATGKIRQQSLKNLVEEIARAKSRLRTTHLSVHLKTKPLLSSKQLAHYDRLRGYRGGDGDGSSSHGKTQHGGH